ncbi:hypothetical protein H311_03437 [Anncaliia algerae PRA109]|nr:hypothetical protein H311_03437 [Anncaliia algerae PRA109]
MKEQKIPRKIKKLYERQNRFEVEKIKSNYPEHLTIEDIDSSDMELLTKCKSVDNSIPVPFFWKYKKVNPIYKLNVPFIVPSIIKEKEFTLSLDEMIKNIPRKRIIGYGELTREGYSFKTQLKSMKPGYMSMELISALNLKEGVKYPWYDKIEYFGIPTHFSDAKLDDFIVKIYSDN